MANCTQTELTEAVCGSNQVQGGHCSQVRGRFDEQKWEVQMVSSRSMKPWEEHAIKPRAEKERNWPKDWPEHYIKVSWAGAQGQGQGLPR